MHEQNDIPDEYRDVPVELLKKGTGRFSHVVLVPQPTDDPNDPLNACAFGRLDHYISRLTQCSGPNGRRK